MTTPATRTPAERITRRLQSRLEMTEPALQSFASKLQDDPAYAFEWADEAMRAAATAKVIKSCIVAFAEGSAPTDVAQACTTRALHAARYPRCSTSQPSNIMQSFEAASFAEYAEFIRDNME